MGWATDLISEYGRCQALTYPVRHERESGRIAGSSLWRFIISDPTVGELWPYSRAWWTMAEDAAWDVCAGEFARMWSYNVSGCIKEKYIYIYVINKKKSPSLHNFKSREKDTRFISSRKEIHVEHMSYTKSNHNGRPKVVRITRQSQDNSITAMATISTMNSFEAII